MSRQSGTPPLNRRSLAVNTRAIISPSTRRKPMSILCPSVASPLPIPRNPDESLHSAGVGGFILSLAKSPCPAVMRPPPPRPRPPSPAGRACHRNRQRRARGRLGGGRPLPLPAAADVCALFLLGRRAGNISAGPGQCRRAGASRRPRRRRRRRRRRSARSHAAGENDGGRRRRGEEERGGVKETVVGDGEVGTVLPCPAVCYGQ